MSSQKKIKLRNMLATNVADLLADIRENIVTTQTHKDNLIIVEYWFDKLDKQKLMDHIIQKVLPYRQEIRANDVNFFYNHRNSIFMGLPQNDIDSIANEFNNGLVSDENINIMFQYFNLFINIGQQYVDIVNR